MERYAAMAKENLRHNLPIPFLVCLVLLVLSPLVVGVEHLTEPETAKVLEYYLVFLGIIVLTPVFLPEQNQDIRDLISSKYTPMAEIYSIRILQAVLGLMVLTGGYLAVMRMGDCTFSFGRMYLGTLAGMIFLGGLGIWVYGLTDQVVIGYMVPVLYYILNVAAGYDKLKWFYLFSMCVGKYDAKWCLGGMGAVLMAAGVVIRIRRH